MSVPTVLALLMAAWSAGIPAASAESCPIYVLERDSAGFSVRTEVVGDGASIALIYGSGTRFVSVLLPYSPGTAGDIVQAAKPHAVMVRCRAGSIETTVQPRGSEPRQQPAVSVAALRTWRLRVNVTGAGGSRAVFIIDPDGGITRDTIGPVMDMFRGMVPLAHGDVSITTEVREVPPAKRVQGTAVLTVGGPWFLARVSVPGGGEGNVIVDLGASRTLLSQEMLPPGIVPRPLVSVEHGPAGRRQHAGAIEAAGGGVGGAGRATLPALDVSGIRFDSVAVNVIPRFPELAGLRLAGVIGADLLRHADVVRIEKLGDGGRLIMGASSRDVPAIEAPFSFANGLILIPARIGDTKLSLLLDTGARGTILSETAAAAASLARAHGEVETFRGLDGQPTEAWPASVSELRIGNGVLRDYAVHVGPLPVLANLGAGDGTGLLGQDIWNHFSALEVDWQRQVVRFFR